MKHTSKKNQTSGEKKYKFIKNHNKLTEPHKAAITALGKAASSEEALEIIYDFIIKVAVPDEATGVILYRLEEIAEQKTLSIK